VADRTKQSPFRALFAQLLDGIGAPVPHEVDVQIDEPRKQVHAFAVERRYVRRGCSLSVWSDVV
jgi:hypothetical protein